MKKVIALLLAACLAVAGVSALADEAGSDPENFATYMMVAVMDPEGNIVTDMTEFPTIVFMVSDDIDEDGVMECYYGTYDSLYYGACTVLEETEESVTFDVALESEQQLNLIYVTAEDTFAYVDAEGYTYMLMNLGNMLDEAEAAGDTEAAA